MTVWFAERAELTPFRRTKPVNIGRAMLRTAA